jgi:ElaB/YqjD/DUF883 family membrane-anchored ribosome-binding protein
MAQPIRNPQPFPNQELESDRELADVQVACTSDDPGILASEAAAQQNREELRGKVVEWKQAAGQTADEVGQRASQAVEEAKKRVSEVYERAQAGMKDALQQGKQKATDALEQGKERATEAARRVRVRTRFYADEYPFHVIAVAAGIGLAVGIFLRIWRSSRYERD